MTNLNTLYFAGAIHGWLLAAALLLIPHRNRLPNAVLAFLVGIIAIPLWNLYISGSSWKHLAVPLYLLWGSIFLWGPALHLYISLVTGQFKFSPRLVFFYLGTAIFVAGFVFAVDQYEILSPEYLQTMKLVRLSAFYMHMAVFFLASFQLIATFKNRICDNYSNIEKLNLSWLAGLTSLFAIAICVDMIFSIPALLRGTWSPYLVFYMLAEAITVFAIGYFAMFKSASFYEFSAESASKPSGQPLDRDLVAKLSTRLNDNMLNAQAFRKNDLQLTELADMVGVRRDILSRYINEHCGKNFYEYVNEFRVKSAVSMLSEDCKANIEKVAFDAGFNNRVSFHNAFKQLTGRTPSQFRNEKHSGKHSIDLTLSSTKNS